MLHRTDNLRIASLRPIISPALLIEEIPLSSHSQDLITQHRDWISQIIKGIDKRLLVVVGPCSIHDSAAAMEYGQRLKTIADKLSDELCIIMRVYFEKPRTTIGWKGLINDPHLNQSFDINTGLHLARKLLVNLTDLGLATGTEFLDTIIPQFISDAISWGAIGARTTESQVHRELASGLSMPIGFKNGTNGNVKIAVDAICSATHPHHFLSISKLGASAIVATKGNADTHIILRGSSHGPNYDAASVATVTALLQQSNLPPHLMIDCSHGNSQKNHLNQSKVIDDICQQLRDGSQAICGVMLESHLIAGQQTLQVEKPLIYGQSITDACISWEDTVPLLEKLASSVKARNQL